MSVDKIEEYWCMYARENKLTMNVPDAWMFGDGSKEMGDELGGLVVKGIKTGTCAAHCIFEYEGEVIPKVGQFDIVLDGENNPLAIIKYTKIDFVKMNEVTNDFASSEGEGDLSYDYWYRGHVKFFSWELNQFGLTFTPDLLLVCQTFKVMDTYKDKL
ncbi:ASCH domain-containing protein [Carnobacterium sp.]|uniref:ASCH domain-containing protein n=1 Tax=Carnobacterium sp. TaxID=48221 RepID=UPI003C7965DA